MFGSQKQYYYWFQNCDFKIVYYFALLGKKGNNDEYWDMG